MRASGQLREEMDLRYAQITNGMKSVETKGNLGEYAEGSGLLPQPYRHRGRERGSAPTLVACPWQVRLRRGGAGEDKPAHACPWRMQTRGRASERKEDRL